MEILCQAAESLTLVASESSKIPSWMMTNDDHQFLLLFITGTYFGPDLKGEKPKNSILQRLAEGLPSYTSDQLSGSQMKTEEAEQIYYYVLRKADQSFVLKLPLLHMFIQGNLSIPAGDTSTDHRQFPDLFPLDLHPQSWDKNGYNIIENIVFINNPEISYIKPENVERFKRLTGLEDLLLDRDAAKSSAVVGINALTDTIMALQESSLRENGHPEPEEALPPVYEVTPFNYLSFSRTSTPCSSMASLPIEVKSEPMEGIRPVMLLFSSHPTTEELNNIVAATKNCIVLTGSAAMRQAETHFGRVNIGECEDAYCFRVSLPGISNNEREFSCIVNRNGWVLIKGLTMTGEKLVYRCSRVFEMHTQNFFPPGHFSISFQLPGPVQPQEFSVNSFENGVLEGVVMKEGMGEL